MKTSKNTLTVILIGIILLYSLPAGATKWVVNVQNFSFAPANLPGVHVGDTIRWVWVSGSHTTTSTTIPFGAAAWDHPITSTNTSYEYPVTVAGAYNYKCTPHEAMGMVGSFTATALNPVLTSISPSQAVQGDSFMATITGSNTNFTGSPAVSMSFSGNPGEIITATSVSVISSTVLHAQFNIPASASTGLWDVHVNSLILQDGFTVLQAVPAITFMSPNFAHQGDSFNASVFGSNTTWTGTPSVYLSFGSNPSEIINGTNVSVVNATEVTADFSIPSNASTGNYTIHVDALDQPNAFTVLAAMLPALSSISPNSGDQGNMVSTTITAENTTFVGSNPAVFLSLHANPSEAITGTNVVVLNNTMLTADFDIPYQATPGLWDLMVDELMLENSFTVIDVVPYLVSIDPNSANQGEQVTTLLTAADSRFTLLSPSVSLSFSGNPSEVINATGINVLSDTQAEAVFDIPSGASAGNWDVHADEMLLEEGFTINLISGIDKPFASQYRLFPNPAQGHFYIENANGQEVVVYNIVGEVVSSRLLLSSKERIGIDDLSNGVYIVRISDGKGFRTERLVVN